MPRKRRGQGFKHVKLGKYHDGRGRGSARRSVSSSDADETTSPAAVDYVSDVSSDTTSVSGREELGATYESDQSCTTSAFEHALSPSSEAGHSDSPEVMVGRAVEQQSYLQSTAALLRGLMPNHWKALQVEDGFHAVQISRSNRIAIQRDVFASLSGKIEIYVHREEIGVHHLEEILKNAGEAVPLTAQSYRAFVDRVVCIVLSLRSYEICAGADDVRCADLWNLDSSGAVDNNPYDESRYIKTFRSNKCSRIVPLSQWRCEECSKACRRLRERLRNQPADNINPFTKNVYLTEKQKLRKLKTLGRKIRSCKNKIMNLEDKVRRLLDEKGVHVDRDLGEELTSILRDSNLSPSQQLFIQQQQKSAMCKGSSGMRWHPAMIRFALAIKSTSSAAYSVLKSTGMITLPSERTLYDYTHVAPHSEGVFHERLSKVGDKVRNYEKEHQHYHSLLMDEIHISQKLVYQKSEGNLVGYVKLNEVEMELKALQETLDKGSSDFEPDVASKMLTYMVKGATNSIKEVVAAFSVSNLSKEQLYDKTWDVISNCEKNFVKIIAVVCDGSAVNRAFISMHAPASDGPTGVIFVTINMCAPDRPLYFIADPPHLLKTIRNCFAKSGKSKRCTRLLTLGGKEIVWQIIERLYHEDMKRTIRSCYKLNSQNVYLNSYSCMKVAYAAQVMSDTVAKDLRRRNWPGADVTADFISRVNNFFDCLNGAHSQMGLKKANPRLDPYKKVDDPRFDELKSFARYLLEWEEEVKNLKGLSETQKAKMLLSRQTLEGIYMTINAFCGVTKFLLEKGASFVNARVFCQDPLEQYFGKQRASGGGSNNPTVSSFLINDSRIALHRDLNVKRKSGNVETEEKGIELSDEPLPKRTVKQSLS